ncbi:MAG: TlpA family protein disulfide reductase [Microthrixaceae bacterium]
MSIRSTRRWAIAAVAVLAVTAAACGDDGGDAQPPTDADEATPTSVVPAGGDESTTSSDTPDTAATPDTVAAAEWQLIEVTDTGGETFTIADLAGRPVFVENFATWCSNCRKQLETTQAAAEQAGDDAVFVALSVETELSVEDMVEYRDDNGFDAIRFAVMSPELLAAMDAAFGGTALNPPATPKVAVGADGAAGELVTGPESAEEILGTLGIG